MAGAIHLVTCDRGLVAGARVLVAGARVLMTGAIGLVAGARGLLCLVGGRTLTTSSMPRLCLIPWPLIVLHLTCAPTHSVTQEVATICGHGGAHVGAGGRGRRGGEIRRE